MATSYWNVDNVTQIGEEKVQIPSENGLSYTSGQKITLFVPPTVQMMDGKNSYLEFDIKLSMNIQTLYVYVMIMIQMILKETYEH